jgi:hypothetical protein
MNAKHVYAERTLHTNKHTHIRIPVLIYYKYMYVC